MPLQKTGSVARPSFHLFSFTHLGHYIKHLIDVLSDMSYSTPSERSLRQDSNIMM